MAFFIRIGNWLITNSMKPREAILSALETFVEPRLGRLKFKFLRGSLAFVRKDGVFTQRIETQLSRWNMEHISAVFDIRVSVRSNYYVKWYKETYCKIPANDFVADCFYLNLKGWQHGSPQAAHPETVELEMLNLLDDLLAAGIPFLELHSNWGNAAERLIRERWFHGRACDFYLIAGNKEKAHWCLEKALEAWEKQPNRSFFLGEKEGIQLRFLKHFGETISI